MRVDLECVSAACGAQYSRSFLPFATHRRILQSTLRVRVPVLCYMATNVDDGLSCQSLLLTGLGCSTGATDECYNREGGESHVGEEMSRIPKVEK